MYYMVVVLRNKVNDETLEKMDSLEWNQEQALSVDLLVKAT